MGILYARVSGAWQPILSGTDQSSYVRITGDTMTGPLGMNAAINVGTVGSISLATTASPWYIDTLGGGIRMYRDGIVGFQADSGSRTVTIGQDTRIGNHPTYGGSAFWRSAAPGGGQYGLLMVNADTHVNAETTGHLRINNADISVWNSSSFNIYTSLNISGTNALNFSTYGGGWYMGDTTWIRAVNGKNIYTSGSAQFDGTFWCGGNLTTAAGMYCAGILNSGGSTFNGASTFNDISTFTADINCGNVNTADGRRVYSKGSYSGAWDAAAVICQQGNNAAEQRTFISYHIPGIWAGGIGAINANGFGVWNNGSGAYEQLSGYLNNVSSRRYKQDVKVWKPQSVGSAVMSAANRLSLIDVVEYRPIMEQHLSVPTADGGGELHDCDVHQCEGTSAEPCARVRDWMNPRLSVVIEDLATVLPEAVMIDGDGRPEAMRLDSMIGYLLAVCKEQQERIEALEHQSEAA